jgi:hypothetical protein
VDGYARGITKITVLPWLGGTPAKVNRHTGEMFLSAEDMRELPFEQRLMIMLHEKGHVVLQTTNEFEADAWATKEYLKMGYSLTEGLKTLTRTLSDANPEHAWRMYMQYQRLAKYDREVNHNTKV